jgi:hypothetical protein
MEAGYSSLGVTAHCVKPAQILAHKVFSLFSQPPKVPEELDQLVEGKWSCSSLFY